MDSSISVFYCNCNITFSITWSNCKYYLCKDRFVPKCNRTLLTKMDYSILVFHSNSCNCHGNEEFHFCVS